MHLKRVFTSLHLFEGECHLYTPDEWRATQTVARADDAASAAAAAVGNTLRVWAIDMAGHFVAGVSGRVRMRVKGKGQGQGKSNGKKEKVKVEKFILLFNSTKGCMLDWQMPHFLYDELFMSDVADEADAADGGGTSDSDKGAAAAKRSSGSSSKEERISGNSGSG